MSARSRRTASLDAAADRIEVSTDEALALLAEASLNLFHESDFQEYGPGSRREARTKLYPGVLEQLYFSSAQMQAKKDEFLQDEMELDLQVGEKTEEQRRLDKLMEKSRLKDLAIEKQGAAPKPASKTSIQKAQRQQRELTAGKDWYDLKPPTMTTELAQDLKILQLRGFADPKKFFKRQQGQAPKHFEVGTLQANALDFYADGRNKAKMSKKHFVDDLLEDQDYKKYAKKRYREIQNSRTGLKRKKGAKKEQKGPLTKRRKF